MTTVDPGLRISVATLDRVIFPHPVDGMEMLALERKASLGSSTGDGPGVRAQPFGGAVRILNPAPLQKLTGEFRFDSLRSQSERDFRILIQPDDWEAVKQFCLHHLGTMNGDVLEADPHRELEEEFLEGIGIQLRRDQYSAQPAGFVIENDPRPSRNASAGGQATARIYRIFIVRITDKAICRQIIDTSRMYTDGKLVALALADQRSGGKGRANAILALPLDRVAGAFRTIPIDERFRPVSVEGHLLQESVLSVLEGIEVRQYIRIPD